MPDGPILFVSYSGLWGGAERIVLDIASGLAEPIVLQAPEGELAARARASGIAVLTIPVRPLELRGSPLAAAAAAARLAAHAREVRALVAALHPRAVVACNMRTAIACAAALRPAEGPPFVIQHQDLLPAGPVGRAVRAAARRADRVVVLSRAIAADLDSGGGLGDRVRVAEPGVDVARYAQAPLEVAPPVALVLGALVPWKRPDLALEAAALAARELPELRVVVAGHAVGEGGGALLEGLRRRAAGPDLAGRVEFAGQLADPRDALGRASCLLHCADREPFGMVLLEAMAGGRPVVAAADAGPLEIVAEGCGRLFAPGDARAAARALVGLLGDPAVASEAGRRARAHARARFDLVAARRRWRAAVHSALPEPTSAEGAVGAGLTVVTVTRGSAEELERLLRSLTRHVPASEVVVVDAGSRDASLDVGRRWVGNATVLERAGVGRGRAAADGVALVRTPACLLLDPSVELVDASLCALAAEALTPAAPERLLAPLLLRPDGTRSDSVAAAPGRALTRSVAALVPGPLRRRVQPWRDDEPRQVAWAADCALGGRTETLARLGRVATPGLRSDEDLELTLRGRDADVATWWWPHARLVRHAARHSQRSMSAASSASTTSSAATGSPV